MGIQICIHTHIQRNTLTMESQAAQAAKAPLFRDRFFIQLCEFS